MAISDSQNKVLFNFVGNNDTTTELDLSWNKFSAFQIANLFAALEKNKTI